MNTSTSHPTSPTDVKPSRTGIVIIWAIVALMFLAGWIAYPYLPDMVPTHWGFTGEPNAWSPKWPGAFIGPFIALACAILFPLLPRLDPKRKNYPDFQKPWFVIQLSIIGFMAYIEAVTIFVTFFPAHNALVGQAITAGVGLLFIILGNVMGKVRQNWFVGLKTPWTLDDPDVWQKSQRVAGWAFVIAGLAIIVNTLFLRTNPYVFFGAVLLVVLGPIVYSYVIYRNKHPLDPPQAERKSQ
jgi:uncharacterized membrane protein